MYVGRAIAQAVIRWLPTAAAQVRSRGLVKWICGGQSGAGAGFFPSTSVSPANLHSTITVTYATFLYASIYVIINT
jgi:hypothetical protein